MAAITSTDAAAHRQQKLIEKAVNASVEQGPTVGALRSQGVPTGEQYVNAGFDGEGIVVQYWLCGTPPGINPIKW